MRICIITKLLPFFMKQLFTLLSDRLFPRPVLLFCQLNVEMNYYRKFALDNKVVGDYCSDIRFLYQPFHSCLQALSRHEAAGEQKKMTEIYFICLNFFFTFPERVCHSKKFQWKRKKGAVVVTKRLSRCIGSQLALYQFSVHLCLNYQCGERMIRVRKQHFSFASAGTALEPSETRS